MREFLNVLSMLVEPVLTESSAFTKLFQNFHARISSMTRLMKLPSSFDFRLCWDLAVQQIQFGMFVDSLSSSIRGREIGILLETTSPSSSSKMLSNSRTSFMPGSLSRRPKCLKHNLHITISGISKDLPLKQLT
jgi:hypothetical protein